MSTLDDHARPALVSIDATIRSSVTVSAPIDLAVDRKDDLALSHETRFAASDPYLQSLRRSWNAGIQAALQQLPRCAWEAQA